MARLEQRAAKYFGIEREPRTSVKVSRLSCLIVCRRRKSGVGVAFYSEEGPRIRADYRWLSDEQRRELAAALASEPTRDEERA